MPQQVFGAAAAVSMLNRAFYNASPSNAIFNNQVQQIGTTEESQILFANQFAAGLANVPAQELVEQVLGNMGLLPNDALVEAGVEALEAYGPGMYGAVVLSFAKLIATLENATGEQEIFRDAAKAWNKEVGAAYNYSSNPANTLPHEGEHVPTPGRTELSLGTDNLFSDTAGTTFTAPVVQASAIGGIANTLETGDVIRGTGTGNKLVADLKPILDGALTGGTAISSTTENIQVVELRVQEAADGVVTHESHIDAQKNAGVREWWTVNSRDALVIEDVRTRPEDTLLGVRNTDPDRDVDLRVYFDPDQLSNTPTASDSALTVTLDNGADPGNLSTVPVNGITFKLAGASYTLQSDELGAAADHAELLAEIQALLAANPALAGVTASMEGTNSIVLKDTQGRAFEKGGWKFINDEVPADGAIVFFQMVGEPAMQDRVVTGNLELDNAGRTGESGAVDIGSMGAGGLQTLNTTVDRASWVSSIDSKGVYGTGERYLETLNLTSKGANGDLKIGTLDKNHVDGRMLNGLTDVQTVEASGFKGALNYGVVLTADAVDRYLKGATGEVVFSYEGGAKADNITIVDAGGISADKDFAMNVDLGAGNDRLNLNVQTVSNVSVDGGTGTNTLALSQSQGTTKANTFKSIDNFQVYEVEANADTNHKVTNVNGLEQVVVATEANKSTTVFDLADGAGLTVSGKNQTSGAGESNNAQTFNTVRLAGSNAASQRVTLDNTARLDGKLTVTTLTVDDATVAVDGFKDASAIRTLEIASNGARNTTNTVNTLNGNMVNTFDLTGTQDLTIGNIASAANSTGKAAEKSSLSIDATALTGKADIGITGAILTSLNADDKLVNIKGTAGDKDVLRVLGGVTTDNDTSISGFETVTFNGQGTFDATNVSGVTLYDVQAQTGTLNLIDLRSTEVVRVNNDDKVGTQGNTLKLAAASGGASSSVTVEYRDLDAATDPAVNTDFSGRNLQIQNFREVTLDLGGRADASWANKQTLQFLDNKDKAVGDAGYDATKVATKVLNVIGGVDQNRANHSVDSLDLGLVETVLTNIDFSGFNGDVKGGWAGTTGVNSTIVVNEYDLTWDVLNPALVVAGKAEEQTLNFAASGALQPGDSVTVTYAGGSYTYTNTGAADMTPAQLVDAIAAAADLPAEFTAASDGAGLLTLTTTDDVEVSGAGDAAAAFTNLANAPALVTVDETTAGLPDPGGAPEVQTITSWVGFGDLQRGESVTITFDGDTYTFTNNTAAAIAEADIAQAILNDTVVLGNQPANFTISGAAGNVRLTNGSNGDVANAVITATADAANVAPVQAEVTNGVPSANDVSQFITSFTFTEDAYAKGIVWQINDFQAFDAVSGDTTTGNLSILNLDALGVDGFADLKIQTGTAFLADPTYDAAAYTAQGNGAFIGALTANDLVITSNEGKNFTIVLTGVTQAELTEENFGNF
ncbi:hypothetical protein GCM10027019_14470 [Melaminivora jejuensis]|uniref:beta strand repeat-containing protein n=1 Tax=Melaminivora jejuensis TaxID=1267217 RepID=UPI001ADFE421|nr:hypothetical protein [Melaminivora jejuensis]UHJ64515.1 hypothetical protein LVC68_14365 [Melaminivora jejuensis]